MQTLVLLVAVFLLFGIKDMAITAVHMRKRRKADALCNDLINKHMGELKMIAESTLIRSAIFNRKGLLVMFTDRLVFMPLGRGDKIEIPFAQITKATASRSIFSSRNIGTRKIDLYSGGQRFSFGINPFVYIAWLAGIEKLASALNRQPIG